MSMTKFTGCLEGQDYLVTDSNLSEMQLEKFVELIVRECIQIVNVNGSHLECEIVSDIKEHFGVAQ